MGVLLARWSWILFAPHPQAVSAPLEQQASAEAGRLFGVAKASDVSATPNVAMPSVRLLGVFAGSPGFAVLEVDGKRQEAFALGAEVVSGVKISEVAADHVALERAGAKQQVELEGQAAALAAARSAVVNRAKAKRGG